MSALSVSQIAERYAVKTETVLAWIHSGSLIAIDVSTARKLPRWRITAESLARFEESRLSQPPVAVEKQKRPKRDKGYVKYV